MKVLHHFGSLLDGKNWITEIMTSFPKCPNRFPARTLAFFGKRLDQTLRAILSIDNEHCPVGLLSQPQPFFDIIWKSAFCFHERIFWPVTQQGWKKFLSHLCFVVATFQCRIRSWKEVIRYRSTSVVCGVTEQLLLLYTTTKWGTWKQNKMSNSVHWIRLNSFRPRPHVFSVCLQNLW